MTEKNLAMIVTTPDKRYSPVQKDVGKASVWTHKRESEQPEHLL